MNPRTIRAIDVWVGKPICAALTLVRRAMWFFRKPPAKPRTVRRMLLIKVIEQGATVLAYRAIARAVEMVGRENVYFIVFEENRFILDLLDLIPRENVLAIRSKKPLILFWDLLAAVFRARMLRIDAAIDMEFFSRASAIIGYLTGARVRVGLHRFTSEGPYRGDLLTHRHQYNPFVHVAAAYYVLVDSARSDPSQTPMGKVMVPAIDWSPPRFVPTEEETSRVQATLDRLAGRPVARPIVLLNSNASDLLPLRRWPAESFEELGKRILQDHPDVTLAITGGPSEAVPARELAARISPTAISTAGETSLRELIVLYSMADVLVTNDSGPGHFATLTDIASIVLFGPETPALFGPMGKSTEVVRVDLACSPCVNAFNHRFSPCNDPVCMKQITVDMVYDRVRERLLAWNRRRSLPIISVSQQAQPPAVITIS
jgi:ADP-heptose:LPS heptosyltransferase